MANELREIAEQIISDFQHSEELAWEMLERAMRLRDEAWRNSFGIVACPTEEKLNARTMELLKAEAKP